MVLLLLAVALVASGEGGAVDSSISRAERNVDVSLVSKNAGVSAKPIADCASCEQFLPQMLEMVHQMRVQGYPSSKLMQAAGEKEYTDAAAEMDVDAEKRMCTQANIISPGFIAACKTVVTAFGLDNVEHLISTIPHMVCAHVQICSQVRSFNSTETLLDHTDVLMQISLDDFALSNLQAGMLGPENAAPLAPAAQGNAVPIAPAAAPPQPAPGSVSQKSIPGLASSNNVVIEAPLPDFGTQNIAAMMYHNQLIEQQQREEHQMMEATRKVSRAAARNRALRRDLRELRKQTWRSQPGNCDCCDACLPAANAGQQAAVAK